MGFFSTLFGLLAKPIPTLTRLEKQEEPLGFELAAGFLTMATFIGATFVTLFLLAGASAIPDPTSQILGAIGGIFAFSNLMIFGVLGAILGAVWYHLWLALFGVRGLRRTMVIYFYARAPALLQVLFFVPQTGGLVLYFLITLWTLFLLVHGIQIFHGLPLRSAAVVVGMAFVVSLGTAALPIGGSRPGVLLFPQVSPLTADLLFPAGALAPPPPSPGTGSLPVATPTPLPLPSPSLPSPSPASAPLGPG